MYNESGFSIRDFALKVILVILFVFLLMWLFPMPNLKPVYDRLFVENIETMKSAAKSYYTVDRLPNEVNGTVKMTLAEMIANKLILPIADSEENICDGQASYVEIMKTDTEYVIKTNLSCSTKNDYVIEHMGCYNLCSDNCEEEEPVVEPEPQKKTTPTKPVVKPVNNKVTLYYLSRDWYKGYTTNTTASTTQYKQVKYDDVKVFDGYSYSCPSGSGDRDGSTCYIYEYVTDYSCSAGTLTWDNKCQVATTTYEYSCPSGYTEYGTKGPDLSCYKITNTYTTWNYYGSGSGKSIPVSNSTYKYESTGGSWIKDCSACSSYLVYTYNIYKSATTYEKVYANPIKTPKTTYEYKEASWKSYPKYTPVAAIATPKYSWHTVVVDSKWTYNKYEYGYTRVDSRVISGKTEKVYTPDWILTLPKGYIQTDKKTEYKWSTSKTESGWSFTGTTKQVNK